MVNLHHVQYMVTSQGKYIEHLASIQPYAETHMSVL